MSDLATMIDEIMRSGEVTKLNLFQTRGDPATGEPKAWQANLLSKEGGWRVGIRSKPSAALLAALGAKETPASEQDIEDLFG